MKHLTAAVVAALLLVSAVPWAHAGVPCHGASGTASWYGQESGRRTATGEYFDGGSMTAATLIYPLGSILRVTDLRSGRSIVVRDNDHGPYVRGRIIDLAKAAAARLGMRGLAKVCVEKIG